MFRNDQLNGTQGEDTGGQFFCVVVSGLSERQVKRLKKGVKEHGESFVIQGTQGDIRENTRGQFFCALTNCFTN